MKLQELLEGYWKNKAIDADFDKQPAVVTPTPREVKMNYMITIEHKPWKKFATKEEAMKIANNVYNRNPRRRVDVVPI
jgi:hypothetical protein